MQNTVDIGSLADALGVGSLVPDQTIRVVRGVEQEEAIKMLSGFGLNVKAAYHKGEKVPQYKGDFYLDFGSFTIRARIPREPVEIRKPDSYKAINEISH